MASSKGSVAMSGCLKRFSTKCVPAASNFFPISSRAMSTKKKYPSSTKVFTKSEARDFMAVFPDLVRELTFEGIHKDVPVINKHLSECIQYNVPTGKKNRGLAVPVTYKLLAPKELHTEENLRLANILGWCVELLQAFFLIADDIMDGSETRRGQLAWYKKDNIGMTAFNDSLLLETCIYSILETHFKEKPYYGQIIHEFHRTTRHTCVGQALDLLTSQPASTTTRPSAFDLDSFDMKRYSAIVKYKTSYYSFYLPVQLGMNMAGLTDPEHYRQARTILLEMGHFFQVQDDYLDCFGDPSVTGKHGTDIQDGKCSWLIVMAMQRATTEQKTVLKDCFGCDDPEKISAVKAIYRELNLPKIFKTYEEDSYDEIITHIDQVPGAGAILPPKLFTTFLDRIYKRDN